jgi:hypothetical protein
MVLINGISDWATTWFLQVALSHVVVSREDEIGTAVTVLIPALWTQILKAGSQDKKIRTISLWLKEKLWLPAARVLSDQLIIGTAGLGLVVAKRLTQHHNFIVAINYSSNMARAEAALKVLPTGCIAIQADVSKRDACMNLVKEAHEKLGGLDLVVANAGWSRPTPFNDIGEWSRLNQFWW